MTTAHRARRGLLPGIAAAALVALTWPLWPLYQAQARADRLLAEREALDLS